GDLLRHVGGTDEEHHDDEESRLRIKEEADDHAARHDREQRVVRNAERFLDVFVGQVRHHGGNKQEAAQDQFLDAELCKKIEFFLPLGHRLLPLVLAAILRVCARAFKLKLINV